MVYHLDLHQGERGNVIGVVTTLPAIDPNLHRTVNELELAEL